jgi:hypothetical protein
MSKNSFGEGSALARDRTKTFLAERGRDVPPKVLTEKDFSPVGFAFKARIKRLEA